MISLRKHNKIQEHYKQQCFRVHVLFMVLFGFITTQATEFSTTSNYSFDYFPVTIIDHETSVKQQFGNLGIKGTFQFLQFKQPPLQGIREIEAQFFAGLAGITWMPANGLFVVDAQGGVDLILDKDPKPTVQLDIKCALPFLNNALLSNVRLSAGGWYSHRVVNAAAMLSSIASTGFTGDLSGKLAGFDFAANYRHDFRIPADTLVDTNFFQGTPHWFQVNENLTEKWKLKTNLMQSFYAYGYKEVLKSLSLGYSYSWNNSEIDRFMMTSCKDTLFVRQPTLGPQVFLDSVSFSFFPYQTFSNEHSHSLFMLLTVPIAHSSIQSKLSFPFYSQKTQTGYYYDSINNGLVKAGYFSQFNYKLKNAAPASFECNVNWQLSQSFSFNLGYNFFCFPYVEWGYFTKDQYSLHTVKSTIKFRF